MVTSPTLGVLYEETSALLARRTQRRALCWISLPSTNLSSLRERDGAFMGQTDRGKIRPFGGGAEYFHVALPHFPAFIQARFCQKLYGHSSDATNY